MNYRSEAFVNGRAYLLHIPSTRRNTHTVRKRKAAVSVTCLVLVVMPRVSDDKDMKKALAP
jgi:hypothetical protein